MLTTYRTYLNGQPFSVVHKNCFFPCCVCDIFCQVFNLARNETFKCDFDCNDRVRSFVQVCVRFSSTLKVSYLAPGFSTPNTDGKSFGQTSRLPLFLTVRNERRQRVNPTKRARYPLVEDFTHPSLCPSKTLVKREIQFPNLRIKGSPGHSRQTYESRWKKFTNTLRRDFQSFTLKPASTVHFGMFILNSISTVLRLFE